LERSGICDLEGDISQVSSEHINRISSSYWVLEKT